MDSGGEGMMDEWGRRGRAIEEANQAQVLGSHLDNISISQQEYPRSDTTNFTSCKTAA